MTQPLISAQTVYESEQRTETLKALIPNIIEEYAVHARLKREKYNALIKENFTPEQAMQIIIAGRDGLEL